MFIASGSELDKAACQVGIIGSFQVLNVRPTALPDEWLTDLAESNADYAAANLDFTVAQFALN